jgi:hypothetical protein
MSALSHLSPAHDAGDLPAMIDRAAAILSGARTAAEVLEAREAAGLAHDVAQASGEVASATSNRGNQWTVPDGNGATSAAEIGLGVSS